MLYNRNGVVAVAAFVAADSCAPEADGMASRNAWLLRLRFCEGCMSGSSEGDGVERLCLSRFRGAARKVTGCSEGDGDELGDLLRSL